MCVYALLFFCLQTQCLADPGPLVGMWSSHVVEVVSPGLNIESIMVATKMVSHRKVYLVLVMSNNTVPPSTTCYCNKLASFIVYR